MGRKSKISFNDKIKAIEDYKKGIMSGIQISKQLLIHDTTFYAWVKSYETNGVGALSPTSKNKSYNEELKLSAIKEYLEGKGSFSDIAFKYGLRSISQLKEWIKKYNGHKGIKSYKSGGNLMTKGRLTTFDERVEIVKYCIEHNNDYNATAQEYAVSYQQVYSWTQKYLKSGVESLKDKRGKCKSEDQMSELEKLRAQNKLLEAENRKKQMEIDFLKKLEEVERGSY